MSFKLEYFSNETKHITLNSDGTIKITVPNGLIQDYMESKCKEVTLDYRQARILKEMIVAQNKLESIEG